MTSLEMRAPTPSFLRARCDCLAGLDCRVEFARRPYPLGLGVGCRSPCFASERPSEWAP